jgi:hypothetical protein
VPGACSVVILEKYKQSRFRVPRVVTPNDRVLSVCSNRILQLMFAIFNGQGARGAGKVSGHAISHAVGQAPFWVEKGATLAGFGETPTAHATDTLQGCHPSVTSLEAGRAVLQVPQHEGGVPELQGRRDTLDQPPHPTESAPRGAGSHSCASSRLDECLVTQSKLSLRTPSRWCNSNQHQPADHEGWAWDTCECGCRHCAYHLVDDGCCLPTSSTRVLMKSCHSNPAKPGP